MATQDDIIAAIRAADKAGDSASVRKLGAYLKTLPQATAPVEYDPTEGMSTADKFFAGAGKAFTDVGRGVGQLARDVMPTRAADALGLPTQADVDEAKRLDAPLMRTTAGTVGNVTGNVATALPAMFIPGAQGLAGAAITGGVMGLTQPVASDESRLKNVAMGAGAGAGGVLAGRVLAAGAKGAKALVEPFTDKGRQAIAGRTLDRFGIQAGDIAGVTGNKTVTGAVPTMAEQIARPEAAAGAARLQDSVRSLDPELASKFVAREAENNAARVATLRDLSGEGGARDFAAAMRNGTAKEQYSKAFSTKMDMSGMSDDRVIRTLTTKEADTVLGDAWWGGKNKNTKRTDHAYTGNDDGSGWVEARMPLDKIRPNEAGKLYDGTADPKRVAEYVGKKIDTPVHLLYGERSARRGAQHAAVMDGGHRVSAARARGDQDIRAIMQRSQFDRLMGRSGTSADTGEITKLMQVPAIQDAMKAAREIAANSGKDIASPEGSVEGLHLTKLAMDDAIEAASKGGSAVAVNKAMSIKTARDRLVTFIEKMAPDYAEARATYAGMSKPLNQMDVADTLFRKGTSATSDLGGTPRLMPDKFVNLLKNEEATVKGATGRDLGKLSQVLEPDQYAKVMAVGQELDKGAAVARAANGPGSATAQRLASQNVLRQILGPTGLPESWAESTLLNTAMRPVQFAYNGVAEPKIQKVLADLLLDPTKARAALQAARTAPQSLPQSVRDAIPYLEQAMKASIPAAALAGQR